GSGRAPVRARRRAARTPERRAPSPPFASLPTSRPPPRRARTTRRSLLPWAPARFHLAETSSGVGYRTEAWRAVRYGRRAPREADAAPSFWRPCAARGLVLAVTGHGGTMRRGGRRARTEAKRTLAPAERFEQL